MVDPRPQNNATFHAVRLSTPTLGLAAAQVGIALGYQMNGWGECKSIYVKFSSTISSSLMILFSVSVTVRVKCIYPTTLKSIEHRRNVVRCIFRTRPTVFKKVKILTIVSRSILLLIALISNICITYEMNPCVAFLSISMADSLSWHR